MAQNILLLNTLESRQLKKEGILEVVRNGQKLTLEFDKTTKSAKIINVVKMGVSYIDPFACDYELRLTQEEHKELVANGSVICERAKCSYLVNAEGAFPMVDYDIIYVR